MMVLSCALCVGLLGLGLYGCWKPQKKQFMQTLKETGVSLLKTYAGIFGGKNDLVGLLQKGLLMMGLLFNSMLVAVCTIRACKVYGGSFWKIGGLLSLGLILLTGIVVLLGYLLMCMDSMHQQKQQPKDKSVCLLVLGQYFILSLFGLLLVLGRREAKGCYYWIVSILAIGELLNLLAFVKIIPAASSLTGEKSPQKTSSYGRCLFASLLLVVLALCGMYLAVCYTAFYFPASYNECLSDFSLFYYVIVTFTTTGYGDIVPVDIQAQAVAVLIMLSNPIYMVLLLQKVISMK